MPKSVSIYACGSNLHQQIQPFGNSDGPLCCSTPVRVLADEQIHGVAALSASQFVFYRRDNNGQSEPIRYITTGFQNEQFTPALLAIDNATQHYSQFLGKGCITACVDSDGNLVWGGKGSLSTGLEAFGAIAMDSQGRVLAFSLHTHELVLYSSDNHLQAGKSVSLAIPGYAGNRPVEIVSGAAHFIIHVKRSQDTDEEAIFGLGDNRFFQQGHAQSTSWEQLHKIEFFDDSMPSVTKIECGNLHTAFLCVDGALYLSGDDSKGQCGGFSEQEPSLVEFPLLAKNASDVDVLDVACGSNHTAVLTSEGVFVTGSNNAGQLGLGHLADSATFVEQPQSVSEMPYKEVFAAGWNTVLLASG